MIQIAGSLKDSFSDVKTCTVARTHKRTLPHLYLLVIVIIVIVLLLPKKSK